MHTKILRYSPDMPYSKEASNLLIDFFKITLSKNWWVEAEKLQKTTLSLREFHLSKSHQQEAGEMAWWAKCFTAKACRSEVTSPCELSTNLHMYSVIYFGMCKHTHTHTHTERERERERVRHIYNQFSIRHSFIFYFLFYVFGYLVYVQMCILCLQALDPWN
jgi:hypothetical protein